MSSHQRKLDRCQRVQGLGGLLLAMSFFLPVFDGCSGAIVPAEEAIGWIVDATEPLVERIIGIVLVTATYLFGLLTVPVSLRFVFDGGRRERAMGWAGAALLWITAAVCLIVVAHEVLLNGPSVAASAFGGIGLVPGGHAIYGFCRGQGEWLSVRWFSAVCCLAFHLSMFEDPRYGLFISLGGETLICTGACAEAKIRCGRGWLVTLGQLACCRLKLLPTGEPRCTKCRYLLIGLTTERCPECGQPFRWSGFGALSEAE